MTRASSPLMAPDSTLEPTDFVITYGSPVRYDSSIVPRPETTSPSTGHTSWGRTSRWSPTRISDTGMSSVLPLPPSTRRWASVGARLASASRTREARAVAASSSASPPESIRTMMAATSHSSRRTAVTMARAARRSAPGLRAIRSLAISHTRGIPPITTTATRGAFRTVSEAPAAERISEAAMAASDATAMTPWRDWRKRRSRLIPPRTLGRQVELPCLADEIVPEAVVRLPPDEDVVLAGFQVQFAGEVGGRHLLSLDELVDHPGLGERERAVQEAFLEYPDLAGVEAVEPPDRFDSPCQLVSHDDCRR